ncbi:MAG TPA: ABC transporter substrate-binding protein [Actinomycetota bacterium]|nr:ABC transporter substrate-binding protein [Actinomycetota bacterium]
MTIRNLMKILLAALLAAMLLAACAEEDSPSSATGGNDSAEGEDAPDEPSCDLANPPLVDEGVLTVATDRPAYPPWFEGKPKNYSGFEGELATQIAERMNLPIEWVVEPFNKSYAPGAKEYDFDINQVSITPEREQAVDFSDGYFNDNQGVLALEGSSIDGATSLADLKDARLGAQVGTTSLTFIEDVIQPNSAVKVYDTTNDVKSALESGQLDALVTDVVTTVYLRDFEIDKTVVVGQYPTEEPFGMIFEEGNLLRLCVNQVLDEMKDDGTLEALQDEWLQDYLGVPTLSDQ